MNYSKQIFEMLDIEPNEEFMLDGLMNIYRITNDLHIEYFSSISNEWLEANCFLKSILNGIYEIKKIIKPTKEEQLAIDYAKACGCKWLAKDKDGCIYAYSTKPIRDNDAWTINDIFTTYEWTDIKIPISFIHWTDEEPYFIG